jgi:DNA polymerase (family 10)
MLGASATGEIALVHWGVAMARKGGVPKERVLNCLDLRAVTDRLAARRKRISRRKLLLP